MKNWIKRFSDPEIKFRPHPFWSWNGELEEAELRRQVRDMAERGLGGFFMHARSGITTPYMGEDWFKMIHACMDEAEKCGMEAWVYDELGWPSGSCGGSIPDMDESYKTSFIKLYEYDGEIKGKVISFYAVSGDTSYRRLASFGDEAVAELRDGEKLMYVSEYKDESYIDVLNPAAVRAFIDSTYVKYKEKIGDGGKIYGFFTDEPQYALCKTAWSTIAEAEFNKTYGYSIIDNLPALFLGRDGHEGIRYDYWKMINRLFTESYTKQLYDWCEENGYLLTGHVMMEDNMLCQIHCTGGCMPSYEYMHVPGIDWLGRVLQQEPFTKESGSPITPLQLGSVAAQLGKGQAMSETFALSGWDISFAEMKQLMEWQFLGGVNAVCQHLEAYTLRGHRKNDYPPSIFYQSPWWNEYKLYVDTMSRIGKLLASGKDDPGILLIHPMHSIWLKYTNDDLCAEEEFDDEFSGTAQILADCHIPYHLGDETIMLRHGSVDGNTLKIGECSYHTVILPHLMGLDRSTYDLLMAFATNGGRLVRMGDVPSFIDGRPAGEEISRLYEMCEYVDISSPENRLDAVKCFFAEAGIKNISVIGENGDEKYIHVCKRAFTDDGRNAYFFLNLDREASHNVKIILDEESVTELHYDTMALTKPRGESRDGKTEILVNFPPMASHLYVTGDADDASEETDYSGYEELDLSDPEYADGKWHLADGSDANCFTIEYCKVSCNGEWSDDLHVFFAEKTANDKKHLGADTRVKYSFNVSEDTSLEKLTHVRVVSEIPSHAKLTINGNEVSHIDGEWWLDHSFSVYEIGPFLKHGENEVEISGIHEIIDGSAKESEFGYLYLVGDFGVFSLDPYSDEGGMCLTTGNRFVIGNRPTELNGGNIVTEGHPFFAGRMILERDIEINAIVKPMRIRIKPGAACARIHVNGIPGKLLAWGDFSDDVTSRIKEGKNTVAVELIIGNRNLLGPWHKTNQDETGAAPEHFIPGNSENWTKNYNFVKSGILDKSQKMSAN